jgi:hypothetical protein
MSTWGGLRSWRLKGSASRDHAPPRASMPRRNVLPWPRPGPPTPERKAAFRSAWGSAPNCLRGVSSPHPAPGLPLPARGAAGASPCSGSSPGAPPGHPPREAAPLASPPARGDGQLGLAAAPPAPNCRGSVAEPAERQVFGAAREPPPASRARGASALALDGKAKSRQNLGTAPARAQPCVALHRGAPRYEGRAKGPPHLEPTD